MVLYVIYTDERMLKMADKKRKEKVKNSLSSMQEVTYSREFKMADRAAGYTDRKSRDWN